jgi:hypothetical protein
MSLADKLTYLAAVILGAIVIAFPLAILINRIGRWWKWHKMLAAKYSSACRDLWKAAESLPPPHYALRPGERVIVPPHKSAAHRSNVMALTKPIPKSAPKSA